MDEDRLARIEAKLDKLSDAVVAIARTEEQIATIFQTQRAMDERLTSQSKELERLRERSHDLTNKVIVLDSCKDKVATLEANYYEMKIETHDNTKMTKRISWAAGVLFSAIVLFIFSDY